MDDLPDFIRDALDQTYAMSLEALQDAYHRMPWGAEITLSNGDVAKLKKFIEPRIRDGEVEAGFDVTEVSGKWHLEFMIRQTGGGRSVEDQNIIIGDDNG